MDDVDIDVVDMLERLQVRNLDPGEEECSFSCPFSGHLHGDEKPSASMNVESTVWYCHGCKRRGNAVTFLAMYENITPMKAARYLREFYGAGFRPPEGGSILHELDEFWKNDETPPVGNSAIDEAFADSMAVDWTAVAAAFVKGEEVPARLRYMLERGFTAGTLNDWKIGFDEISDRIAIPVRNVNGQLVGFKGRAWHPDRDPKYLSLGDKRGTRYGYPTYEKSRVVFGLDRIAATVKRAGKRWPLILVEGELDVISMWQKGIRIAVACEGSILSDVQERLIRDYASEVTLLFDDDRAGHEATADAMERLMRYVPVKVVGEHDGDPAELSARELVELTGSARSSVEVLIDWNA